MDRLAERLRATFLAELEEQVRVMNADLLVLEREPTAVERLKSVFRVAHTLKGAARAAGVPHIEQACHALESLLAKARDGRQPLTASSFGVLFAAADALADARQRLARGEDLEGSLLTEVTEALVEGRAVQDRKSEAAAAPITPAPEAPVRPEAERMDAGAQIRIDETVLDDLLAAVTDLRQAASAVVPSSAGGDARALRHAVDEVTSGAVRLRMRPFSELCDALPRVVRDTSAAERKNARLEIHGGAVRADRAVLDALREPLAHLARNAVAHGIEEPRRRAAAGKPQQGTVTVSAALRAGRLLVRVADDGAGVDTEALRRLFARAGRELPADDAALAAALFDAGISTRDEATVVAGRGVGLDVVREAVLRINGTVNVEWTAGKGTAFTLDCPVTLAVIRVVLARVGSYTLAIPTAAVERLLRVAPDTIARAEGRDVLPGPDGPVRFVSLARVLGPPYLAHEMRGATPAVQLLVGGRRLAVAVDALVDECEVTVRPLDQRQPLPLVSGAAIVAGAGAAPVLNAHALVAEGLRTSAGGLDSLRASAAQGTPKRRILVVDDSITTRTLEKSVLDAAGYDVVTAVDGADGWRVIQTDGCDLIVSDVEMPRMDGFELCAAVRASPRFARLPIILVTALESEEQRARGLAAGANAYLGKSSFDQQTLLDVVEQYLG